MNDVSFTIDIGDLCYGILEKRNLYVYRQDAVRNSEA